jgi:uncharacterized protein with HEPN domain
MQISDIKQELDNLSAELREIGRERWAYLNEMLRFSVAAWIFGFACFFSTVLYLSPQLVLFYPGPFSFLLLGEAAALVIIGLRMRRFDLEIKKLASARRKLLLEYQKLVLSHVKRMVREGMPLLAKAPGKPE